MFQGSQIPGIPAVALQVLLSRHSEVLSNIIKTRIPDVPLSWKTDLFLGTATATQKHLPLLLSGSASKLSHGTLKISYFQFQLFFFFFLYHILTFQTLFSLFVKYTNDFIAIILKKIRPHFIIFKMCLILRESRNTFFLLWCKLALTGISVSLGQQLTAF